MERGSNLKFINSVNKWLKKSLSLFVMGNNYTHSFQGTQRQTKGFSLKHTYTDMFVL